MREFWTANDVINLRERLGQTQAQFCSTVSVSLPTLRRWEAAKGRLSTQAQNKLDALESSEWKTVTDWLQQFNTFAENAFVQVESVHLEVYVAHFAFKRWCKLYSTSGVPTIEAFSACADECGFELIYRGKEAPFYARIKNTAMRDFDNPVSNAPPEPSPAPGPRYGAGEGLLVGVPSPPDEDDLSFQSRLLSRLQKKVLELSGLLASARNQYPELARTVDEYQSLLSSAIE